MQWSQQEIDQLDRHADEIEDSTEKAKMKLMVEKARQQLRNSDKNGDSDWEEAVTQL